MNKKSKKFDITQLGNIAIIPKTNTKMINGKEHVYIPLSVLLGEIPLKPAPIKVRKLKANQVISDFKNLLKSSGYNPDYLKLSYPKEFEGFSKYETVNIIFNHPDLLENSETIDILFKIDRESLAKPVKEGGQMKVSYNIRIEALETLIKNYDSENEYDFLKKIYWDLLNFEQPLLNIIEESDFNNVDPIVNFKEVDDTLNFEFIFPDGILSNEIKENKLKAAIDIDGNHGGLYTIYTKEEKAMVSSLIPINRFLKNERTFTQVTKIIEFEIFEKYGVKIPKDRVPVKSAWLNEPATVARKARLRKEKIQKSIDQ